MLEEARTCVRCHQLAASRTQVVVGTGDPDAEVMFVGEAPGRTEDEQGRPFVGAVGELLDDLLAGIGLTRDAVYLTTCVKCRPPGNRDALPSELANCRPWLHAQIDLVRPRLVCPLGNFATRQLRGDPTSVTRIHGQDEVRVLGARAVRLLPLLHPAAALYTRSLLDELRADVARIPGLLALPDPDQPAPAEPPPSPPAPEPDTPDDPAGQLGLF